MLTILAVLTIIVLGISSLVFSDDNNKLRKKMEHQAIKLCTENNTLCRTIENRDSEHKSHINRLNGYIQHLEDQIKDFNENSQYVISILGEKSNMRQYDCENYWFEKDRIVMGGGDHIEEIKLDDKKYHSITVTKEYKKVVESKNIETI